MMTSNEQIYVVVSALETAIYEYNMQQFLGSGELAENQYAKGQVMALMDVLSGFGYPVDFKKGAIRVGSVLGHSNGITSIKMPIRHDQYMLTCLLSELGIKDGSYSFVDEQDELKDLPATRGNSV